MNSLSALWSGRSDLKRNQLGHAHFPVCAAALSGRHPARLPRTVISVQYLIAIPIFFVCGSDPGANRNADGNTHRNVPHSCSKGGTHADPDGYAYSHVHHSASG
jgi:hypothetical protein